jgi:hypothetical protein
VEKRLVLCTDGDLAVACVAAAESAGIRCLTVSGLRTPPASPLAWERAVSELALCQWLLLPSSGAAEAVLEAAGAPPGPATRVAAVGAAGDSLTAAGRRPDVDGDALGTLLRRLGPALGRRQRVLVPHLQGAGLWIDGRLRELGADPRCVAAYGYGISGSRDWAWPAPGLLAAVAATPDDVEVLAVALEAVRPGALGEAPLAVHTAGAEDAAADCGFGQIRRVGDDLGPFLAAAFAAG